MEPDYNENRVSRRVRPKYEVPKTNTVISEEPYMSTIRMKNRQNQPINIYNDHLVG